MKVVVDEGVPRDLVRVLCEIGVDAHRFPAEWRNLTNGKLIAAAEIANFDCLLTNDRNMASQTNLSGRRLSVVALPSNKLSVIIHRAEDIADTINRSLAGQHLVVSMDGSRFARQTIDGTTIDEALPSVVPFK